MEIVASRSVRERVASEERRIENNKSYFTSATWKSAISGWRVRGGVSAQDQRAEAHCLVYCSTAKDVQGIA